MDKNYLGAEIRILSNLIRRKAFSIDVDENVGKAVGCQGFIIKFLYDNLNNEIFQKDIEKHFKVRRSSVTSALSRMEEAGLISRCSVERDSRLKKILLTQKGLDLHYKIEQKIKETEELLTSSLTDEEYEAFFHIIKKLQKSVE